MVEVQALAAVEFDLVAGQMQMSGATPKPHLDVQLLGFFPAQQGDVGVGSRAGKKGLGQRWFVVGNDGFVADQDDPALVGGRP